MLAILAFSTLALGVLVLARTRSPPSAPSSALLAILALVALPGNSHADGKARDTRRGRFIPAPSRAALDEIASDIRKLRVRRHGMAGYPAWGRVDAALHALLGLIPYPTETEERELLEDALRCLETTAPDVARALAERMRAHYLRDAEGGARHAH